MKEYENNFNSYWLRIMSGDRSRRAGCTDAMRTVNNLDNHLKFLLRKLKDTVPPLKYKGVDAVPLYINYMEALALLALIIAHIGDEE